MVTCVDVCGMNVMTASLDGSIALWDLRVSDAHNTITTIKAAGNESVRQTAFWEGLWGCCRLWSSRAPVASGMRGPISVAPVTIDAFNAWSVHNSCLSHCIKSHHVA
jgi:hypothetical protein